MPAPSVILLEIDATSLAIFEFECDAPRAIDVHRIALRIEPMQGMKIETREVHFLWPDGNIETVQPCENAFVHLRVDFRTPALRPQLRKSLAFEGSDHETSVSKQLTSVNKRLSRVLLLIRGGTNKTQTQREVRN